MGYIAYRKNKSGAAFAEYVLIIVTAAAAIIMVSRFVYKAVRGKVAAVTDTYIGKEKSGELSPLNVSGGKQLVEQYGTYRFSGETSVMSDTMTETGELGGGARAQAFSDTEMRFSPGSGFSDGSGLGTGFQITALPQYQFEDREKAPVYVPPYVKAEEGFIPPPRR